MTGDFRIEKDSMGEMQVPAKACFGAQTQRAVLNFPISGIRFPRRFLGALGLIKKCAARVNAELGLLPPDLAEAIDRAASDVAAGVLDDQFPLDVFQTGSGTSTNMNANEVIAARADEILGTRTAGTRRVHPNDHVNLGQSSNDVIPSASHVAAALAVREDLIPALETLAVAFETKVAEFRGIVKIGRTHLQDATPILLSQEISGWAAMCRFGVERLVAAEPRLAELALGGTAVGTGINTHPEFGKRVSGRLATETGLPFREARNHFEAQGSRDALVELSGALRTIACSLTKIANDVRWLSSGPRCGLGEIEIPATQPGSSIMPGKVNPVIAESLLMVCAQVVGNDAAVAAGGLAGNFELNVMIPVMAVNVLQSVGLLAAAARNFEARCARGMKAVPARCEESIEKSLAMCTALAPRIGYDRAAAIAKEAWAKGRTVREIAREMRVLPDAELDRVLDPTAMTRPGLDVAAGGGG